jgi:PPOX class probable F420-dependent enzyme
MKLEGDARELLDAPFPCSFTTLTPAGAPHSVVIWCTRDGDRVTVNGAETAWWLKNVRRDPRVSVIVLDPAEILRYVEIRGRVTDIREDVGIEHQTMQAQLYDGTETYAWARPNDTRKRYVVSVEPERVRVYAPQLPAAIVAARARRSPGREPAG